MADYISPRIDRARVLVSPDSGTTWYDLTTRVLEITVAKQKDGGTSTVDVTFANAPADGDNLSPLVTPLSHPSYFMAAAQVNSGGQQLPAKLLDIGNTIAIDGAYTTDGSEPTDADLYPVFVGVLGAQTKVGHDENGNRTVSVHALDYASGRLNAYYLNDTTGISPGAPEAVIQNILDKALGAGVMTLYVPVASQGDVTQNGIDNLVQNTTAWQAIQSIAEQIGFDCRWLWQPSLGAWRLTFYQPSRDMSAPDYTVDITGMYLHELDTTDSYLRNQCTVEYRDSTDGTRKTVTVQDTTGPYNVNSKVGVRAVYITEADTSIIDTAAEATTLAQTVVDDLSNLYAQVEVDLPFEPSVEIYKKLQATDAYISDTPQTYAMDSVEHRMAHNEWTTTVKLSGSVSLRKDAWLQKHGAPGAKRPFRLGDYRDRSVAGGVISNMPIGTAFPPSPSTGQFFFRTDQALMYRYDGTAWNRVDITQLPDMGGTLGGGQLGDLTPDGYATRTGNRLQSTDANASLRVAMGDLAGLAWGSTALPTGTYGLWGDLAGIYMRGYPRVISWGGGTVPWQNVSVAAGGSAYVVNTTITLGGLVDQAVSTGRQLIGIAWVANASGSPAGFAISEWIAQVDAVDRSSGLKTPGPKFAGGTTWGSFDVLLALRLANFTSGALNTMPVTGSEVSYGYGVIEVEA